MTKKERLIRLRELHPNWTTKQYAAELGQNPRVVAVTISKLKNPALEAKRRKKNKVAAAGNPIGRPRKVAEKIEVKIKKTYKKPAVVVYSKCGPTRSGYYEL